jgi:iron complex transport system permease protein
LVGLLLAVALAAVAVGAKDLTPAQTWHALVSGGADPDSRIVRELRVPRTLLGLAAGCALGLAGALVQGYTRNPIADTSLLGLNSGAAFFAVLAIHVLGLGSPSQYVWFALTGAALAGLVVYGAASAAGRGSPTPATLVVAGAAVTFLLQALTNAVVLLDPTTLDSYRFWVVGSTAGRGSDVLWRLMPFLVVGAVLAVASGPRLNVLSLGDDVARGLGVPVHRARATGLVAVVLLAGAATAACGPIAFLGLAVPHLARALTGPDHRWLLPYSAVLGATVLVAADTVGRVVARPGEVAVGIVLAVCGAPFFVALVRRRKLVRL